MQPIAAMWADINLVFGAAADLRRKIVMKLTAVTKIVMKVTAVTVAMGREAPAGYWRKVAPLAAAICQ